MQSRFHRDYLHALNPKKNSQKRMTHAHVAVKTSNFMLDFYISTYIMVYIIYGMMDVPDIVKRLVVLEVEAKVMMIWDSH
jgi:hypothetical protein